MDSFRLDPGGFRMNCLFVSGFRQLDTDKIYLILSRFNFKSLSPKVIVQKIFFFKKVTPNLSVCCVI